MKYLLLSLMMMCAAFSLAAQDQSRARTQVVADCQEDNSVVFQIFNKEYPGTQTVLLSLSNLKNCSELPGMTFHKVCRNGETIFRLRQVDTMRAISYVYSYVVVNGAMNPKVDNDFVYRIPCPAGKLVRVHSNRGFGETEPNGYCFEMEHGDTVYAARRGVVTQVELGILPGGLVFSQSDSRVVVEHPDGTMASYACFAPGQILTREGDLVFPDTPLGLAGKGDDSSNSGLIYLQVFRFVSNQYVRDEMNFSPDTQPILPLFAANDDVLRLESGDVYHPEADEGLISREMTKKEHKRWRSNKK